MQSLIRSQLLGRLDVARTFASGAILSLVCVLTIPLGFAQSVDYVGRAFKVDSFKELDGENVAVEVAGQTLFASRGGVGRATFKMYAQKPELLLSDGGLKGYATWLATLPSKGDEEGAILGVEHVVVSSEIKAGEKITFYGELVDSPGGERMLFRTVSALSGSEAGACSALAFLSAESQRALKSGGHEWVSQRCPQPLVDMAREVLMEGYRDPGIAMLRTAALFSGNGGIGDAARTSISRLEAIERALLSQDPAELDSALKVASFDALLSAYFEDTRPAVVTEFSVRALREGHPIVALRGLSLLDFSVRNTSHHELVSRALEQVPFEDRADVRNSSVRSLLSSYSMKDEFVKRRYEAILEAWIRRLVDNDKPGEARSFFFLM
jgi:hypothetical protein